MKLPNINIPTIVEILVIFALLFASFVALFK